MSPWHCCATSARPPDVTIPARPPPNGAARRAYRMTGCSEPGSHASSTGRDRIRPFFSKACPVSGRSQCSRISRGMISPEWPPPDPEQGQGGQYNLLIQLKSLVRARPPHERAGHQIHFDANHLSLLFQNQKKTNQAHRQAKIHQETRAKHKTSFSMISKTRAV